MYVVLFISYVEFNNLTKLLIFVFKNCKILNFLKYFQIFNHFAIIGKSFFFEISF